MQMNVSRATLTRADGKPACSVCGAPVERTRKAGGQGRPQSYCNGCHAKDVKRRRQNTVNRDLSPEEWAAIRARRAAAEAGQ